MTAGGPPKKLFFVLIFDRQGAEAGRFLLRDGENWAGIPIESESYAPAIDLEPFDLHHFVSRRHAVVHKNGEKVEIEHMSKTNPTAVNGTQLKHGKPQALKANDEILFSGRIRARFVVEDFPAS